MVKSEHRDNHQLTLLVSGTGLWQGQGTTEQEGMMGTSKSSWGKKIEAIFFM